MTCLLTERFWQISKFSHYCFSGSLLDYRITAFRNSLELFFDCERRGGSVMKDTLKVIGATLLYVVCYLIGTAVVLWISTALLLLIY